MTSTDETKINQPTPSGSDGPSPESGGREGGRWSLERFAQRTAAWMEKWFPDSFAIAIFAVAVVCLGALTIGASPRVIVETFGNGFWDLIPFAAQMSVLIVGGYVLATAKPVLWLIERLANVPSNSKSAVAFLALCVVLASFINWGFCMIFGGLMARAMARRTDLRVDYRAASAAAFTGMGSTTLLGLSAAPPLLHATPSSVPEELYKISGYIPLTETIFRWQSLLLFVILGITVVAVAYATAPSGSGVRTAQDMGVDVSDAVAAKEKRTRPGEWLEFSRLPSLFLGALMLSWLALGIIDNGLLSTVSNLNSYNFIIFAVALLLHGNPRSFVEAAQKGTPSVAGVIIQFPIYAGVAAVLVSATNGSGESVGTFLTEAFTEAGSTLGLPFVVGVYSCLLGLFIPSAGAKWVLEAPYVFQAAAQTDTNMGWLIQVYCSTESFANLLNPFWMLPLLGLVGLRARNIVGFTSMYFIFLVPVAFVSIVALSTTMGYVPPVFP